MVVDTSLGSAGMAQEIAAGNAEVEDTAEGAGYAEEQKQTAQAAPTVGESDYNTAYENQEEQGPVRRAASW